MNEEKQERENEWDELQDLLDGSFKTMDQEIEESTPPEQWFEQFTLNQQDALKHKYRKEMAAFLAIAMLTISSILFALYESPILFAVIQGTAFIAAISYGSLSNYKQVKRT
ncbi:YxlC family protein [Bacillus sp. AK031]